LHDCADVISFNPANYTAWHFRRLLLKALDKDLSQELFFCTEIAEENLKNYQVTGTSTRGRCRFRRG
jgi:protein farnesyltransferase/geranylgeranyltransferase type-1 subunit alpha